MYIYAIIYCSLILQLAVASSCDSALTPKNTYTQVTNLYVENGPGVLYDMSFFFTDNAVAGCTITCNYGDTCGSQTTLSSSFVSVTNANSPYQIKVLNDQTAGYSAQTVCLYCTSTNSVQTFVKIHDFVQTDSSAAVIA